MKLDYFLHLIIGGVISIKLFSEKVHALNILIMLFILAFSKEIYDHFFILGHCYPFCMEEHIYDFSLSFLLFFLYIPPLKIIRNNALKKPAYIAVSWLVISILNLSIISIYDRYISQNTKINLARCK